MTERKTRQEPLRRTGRAKVAGDTAGPPRESDAGDSFLSRCRVEALIGLDERGQMVLPKTLRERAGLKPGDKLAAVTWDCEGQACCICLIKVDRLGEMARSIIGPAFGGGSNSDPRKP